MTSLNGDSDRLHPFQSAVNEVVARVQNAPAIALAAVIALTALSGMYAVGTLKIDTDTAGTVITTAHSGKPCRLIDNNYTREWASKEEDILPYPLQVRQFGEPASDRGRIQGDVENGVLPAGQSVGLIHEVKTAGDVVRDVVAEAEAALKRITL